MFRGVEEEMMGLVFSAFVLAIMMFSVARRWRWDDDDP